MSTQTILVDAVQAGDQRAFEELVEPYQRELLVHCYRMLGSFQDAEDLLQETLLRAWEKRSALTSPASYRAWLYRIATNLCLDRLRSTPRRSLPTAEGSSLKRVREPIFLEPFPDDLEASWQSDPHARVESKERTTLAFLVALHRLTPAQRAILLLREVLDWPAHDVATWLNVSVAAVNSGLQRARRALQEDKQASAQGTALLSPPVQALLERYVTYWEQADIPGLAALLREDAWFSMPPLPVWLQGRTAIASELSARISVPGRRWQLLPTRANGCPAFGLYRRDGEVAHYQLFGLMVLGVMEGQIAHMVAFLELSGIASFALPSTLP